MILNRYFTGLVMAGLLSSCSLFRVPNIEDSPVVLRAPADSVRTYTQTQTFYWNAVEDADGYNLQIVSPRFDSIAEIVLDTNLSNNSFIYTLSPGAYEWGVFAFNSGYSTYQSIFSLTITVDSSNNLANQKIRLLQPGVNFNTNKLSVFFQWESLPMASYYIFEIRDTAFSSGNVFQSIKTSFDTISLNLPEGKYTWGVQGHNDLTITDFAKRSLIVDTTAPNNPIITIPENNGDTIRESPYLIMWNHPKSSLSAITDNVYIATDSLFNQNLTTYETTLPEQSLTDLESNTYYVKIRSYDLAGNRSGFSITRKFVLQK